ncbi:MAG: chemotaxis response regulator protein-glutamate methylesterase [Deltaproteobacteria bacterium]|nr:chemotaxis response regulator protein-glutamate methylesterase [Deltaproteobacteria bacterium]
MKIGIVNDSRIAAEILRRIIRSADGLELLWSAPDGAEAVKCCQRELPDLVLMDLIMPGLNGVEATRLIMKNSPCAILVVTASVTGNSSLVFEAMGVGALDVVATPILQDHSADTAGDELLRKIKIIGHLIGCSVAPYQRRHEIDSLPQKPVPPLVVIGASTGGPQALTAILSCLPDDYQPAVVIIQHMDKKFTPSLASWLNEQINLPVKLINEADRPESGTVLLANTNVHLQMTSKGRLSYSIKPENNFYHPSVDVFLLSVAKHWSGKIVAVLLTGMGRDGALGLLAIKKMGGYTIAQDEESSVVYGMPKAARDMGAADEILSLQEIGPRIIELT